MLLRMEDGRRFHLTHLLRMAKNELGLTQYELGVKLGVSRRTMIRWGQNQTRPAWFEIERLVSLLREEGHDDVADSLLEAAGLPVPVPPDEPPAPPVDAAAPAPAQAEPAVPPAPPPQHLIEAVLYAAADAADLAPRQAALALRAAFRRARELGLPGDAVAQALLDG